MSELKAVDLESLQQHRSGIAFKVELGSSLEIFYYNLEQATLALKKHMEKKGALGLSLDEVQIEIQDGTVRLFRTWTQQELDEERGI